jgi:hypothetical protein
MQSSACSTTFGDLLLHANSNGKKYFSASFTSMYCLFLDSFFKSALQKNRKLIMHDI